VLIRIIGATTPASSTIICAFMGGLALGGLALGSLAGSRLAKSKRLLQSLAILEFLIFVCAMISSQICQTPTLQQFGQFFNATVGDAGAISITGFLLIFGLIFIPTALMGATFPVMAAYLSQRLKNGSVMLMRFYALNSTGAVFGAFLSGFYMMPLLGIERCLAVTGGFNLLAALICLFVSKLPGEQLNAPSTESETELPAAPSEETQRTLFLALLVFATGAMSFAMEIVWTRFLILLVGSSTYALSLMLTVFISGLSAGAWVAWKIGELSRIRLRSISVMLVLTSSSLALSLYQYESAPSVYLMLRKIAATIGTTFWNETICMLSIAVFLMFLTATTMGTIFPLVIGAVADGSSGKNKRARLSKQAALLYGANVIGSMVGSFGCGVVILPAMAENFHSAIQGITFLVAAGYLIASVVTLFMTPKPVIDEKKATFHVEFKRIAIICFFNIVVLAIHPQWEAALLSSGIAYVSENELKALSVPELIDALSLRGPLGSGQNLLMYSEGANTTISVVSNPKANLVYLKTNGKSEAAIPLISRLPAPESDLPTQKLLGLIPTIKCAGDQLSGLVIGYGSGTTCSAALSPPWVKKITAVELEKSIWTARQYFRDPHQIDDQSKLRRVTSDARNFLLRNNTDKFDFIVSQPAEPWLSGASDLYTVEFYQLAKNRLVNTGMFCQWIPLYSLTENQLRCLLETFRSVFPDMKVWHTLRAGELIVTGQLGYETTLPIETKRIDSPEIARQFQQIGFENRFDLNNIDLPYAPALQADSPLPTLNTDDNLLVEGLLAREMADDAITIDGLIDKVFGKQNFTDVKNLPAREPDSTESLLAEARSAAASTLIASDPYYLPSIGEAIVSPHIRRSLSEKISALQLDEAGLKVARFRIALHTGETAKAAQILASIDLATLDTPDELNDAGAVLFMSGKLDQAEKVFSSALQLKPYSSRALAGVGLCHWQAEEWKEASDLLNKSLSIDPNQFLARYALGQSLFQVGQKTEGLTNMRAAGIVNAQSILPGMFVTAYDITAGNLELATANQHLVMRKKSRSPDAIALGFLIDDLSNRKELSKSLQTRYREITASDITVSSAKELVDRILKKPYSLKMTN
jgi:spermidine synthase